MMQEMVCNWAAWGRFQDGKLQKSYFVEFPCVLFWFTNILSTFKQFHKLLFSDFSWGSRKYFGKDTCLLISKWCRYTHLGNLQISRLSLLIFRLHEIWHVTLERSRLSLKLFDVHNETAIFCDLCVYIAKLLTLFDSCGLKQRGHLIKIAGMDRKSY